MQSKVGALRKAGKTEKKKINNTNHNIKICKQHTSGWASVLQATIAVGNSKLLSMSSYLCVKTEVGKIHYCILYYKINDRMKSQFSFEILSSARKEYQSLLHNLREIDVIRRITFFPIIFRIPLRMSK